MEVVVVTRRYPNLDRSETVEDVAIHRLGHASASKAGALSFALHTLWLLATRFRRFRIVHAQNPDTPLLIGFVAKIFLRRKLVVTLNSDPAVVLGRGRRSGALRIRLTRYLADAVGALSHEMAEALVKSGLARSQVHLLPSGVDTRLFRPPKRSDHEHSRRHLHLAEDAFVCLFVGRLAGVKRIDVLVRAWSRLATDGRRRALLILGEGPKRGELERLTSELGLTDVRFEPQTEDVSPYLRAADAFVLPSEREGLSSALLEAMAVGLPAVASDLWGNRALVEDGHSGLTFPVGDAQALAECLASLESSELRQRLGRRAARIAQEYSIERTAELHRNVYSALGHES